MALDSTQVRIAPFGHVYVAPVGTAAPVDVLTAYSATWKELGYISEDGVGITPSVDVADIKAWQSLLPVKQSLTGMDLELTFDMIQVNQQTSALYFFGSAWVTTVSLATMTISSSPSLDERALSIEWKDDANYINRLTVGRGLVTDRDQLVLKRSDAVAFGVTFHALDSNGTAAVLMSNNPSLINS
jgi:hypothetical protein